MQDKPIVESQEVEDTPKVEGVRFPQGTLQVGIDPKENVVVLYIDDSVMWLDPEMAHRLAAQLNTTANIVGHAIFDKKRKVKRYSNVKVG